MPPLRPLVLAALVLGTAVACGNGDGGDAGKDAAPETSTSTSTTKPRRGLLDQREEFPAYAVDAKGPKVDVYDRPDGGVVRTFDNPQPSGAPLVFLQERREGEWLNVFLPARPNGSTGWVRRADVTVRGVAFRVEVLRGAHSLKLYERDQLVREFPVGIGTNDTPTPGGTFYIKELLEPPNPDGDYGPYAYGLSGFSNVLTNFNGGAGVIGIHGTNQPGSVGRDVSHGCIRMRNEDIRYLAERLPLGTPVKVLA
ncbi:MAG TPA: L,D-transpeptidase [Acidimicrobiales bacterium]|nr:L,D-transpeptidase [Acidimicrobiales bacterium]